MSAEDQAFIDRCLAAGSQEKIAARDVAPLIRDYYAMPNNGAGGSLHVMLDDGNYECAQFCLDWAIEAKDKCGEALCRVLLRCSYSQIKKATRLSRT